MELSNEAWRALVSIVLALTLTLGVNLWLTMRVVREDMRAVNDALELFFDALQQAQGPDGRVRIMVVTDVREDEDGDEEVAGPIFSMTVRDEGEGGK